MSQNENKKILHLCTTSNEGGAAMAMHRLHLALRERGHDSSILCLHRQDNEPYVTSAFDTQKYGLLNKLFFTKLKMIAEYLTYRPYRARKNKVLFSSGAYATDITRHPLVLEADILHLHWINMQFISIKEIERLGRLCQQQDKKLVFTMHDMWLGTGGCHYSDTCMKYQSGCFACPILEDGSGKEDATTARVFASKKKHFSNIEFSIITPSNWMGEVAKSAFLLKGREIAVIANNIDYNTFTPMDKVICRELLRLDTTTLCLSATADSQGGAKPLLAPKDYALQGKAHRLPEGRLQGHSKKSLNQFGDFDSTSNRDLCKNNGESLNQNEAFSIFRDRFASQAKLQKRYIIFGASGGVSNERKGYAYLYDALVLLHDTLAKHNSPLLGDIELVIFGGYAFRDDSLAPPFTYHFLGNLKDERSLALAYNASDVYVTPSLEDNLPNIINEALACALPCVGFDIGGIPDMIDHKSNGYLAKYKDTEDLMHGIAFCLDIDLDSGHYNAPLDMVATNPFSTEDIVAKHLKVYGMGS